MKEAISKLIVTTLCCLTVLSNPIISLADSSKVVTLGVDLSEEQRSLILNYFNVTENEVMVVDVTNQDEHRYLDGVATQQQIGTRTYSCSYIEPTNEGGINIKTANLNWVTCDMIRNALITSGITNCNVICASPIEVSGTGALTGIFMAYEQVSEEELDAEKVEIASEELIKTMDIAETIGQEEASNVVSDLKEEIIVNEVKSEEDIQSAVNIYIQDNKIEITDEQKENLVELLLKISQQEYNIDEIKKTYEDLRNTVDDIKEVTTETKNFLEKIIDWIVTLWQKITGTYEEIKNSEEYEAVKEQIGILSETKDSLLGDDTVITSTSEVETKTETPETPEIGAEQFEIKTSGEELDK